MSRRLRLRKRRLRMLLSGFLLPVLLLFAGCGSEEQRGTAERDTRDPGFYGNDGYMGLSNTNPNLPLTGTAWSYEEDREFAAKLLRPLTGIERTRITMRDDAAMHVTLVVDDALSREETSRLVDQAERVLAENFPRYNVTVEAQ